jgi:hypothetical protein
LLGLLVGWSYEWARRSLWWAKLFLVREEQQRMKAFVRTHRLLPLATVILLLALLAVSLLSSLVQVQWHGSNGISWSVGRLGTHALADSTSWTPVSGLPTNTVLTGIACPNGGGLLCAAVGVSPSEQAVILTTTNGTSWTPVAGLPANTNLNGIACPDGGGLLCAAVGDTRLIPSEQAVILTTTNGTSWTPVAGLPANTNLNGIACSNGGGLLCAAVGYTTTGSLQAVILTTTNGTSWTPVADLPTGGLNGIACPNGGGLLCAAVGTASEQPLILFSSTATSPDTTPPGDPPPPLPSPSPILLPTLQLVQAPSCLVPVSPTVPAHRRGRGLLMGRPTFTTTSMQTARPSGQPHLVLSPPTVSRSPSGCVVFVVSGTGFSPNKSVVISIHGASLTVQSDASGSFTVPIGALVSGPVLTGTVMITAIEGSPGAFAWAVLTVS